MPPAVALQPLASGLGGVYEALTIKLSNDSL